MVEKHTPSLAAIRTWYALDHAAEAKKILHDIATAGPDDNLPEDWSGASSDEQWLVHASLEEAQVHATLALVEQQRIANLIALAQMRSEVNEVEGQAESLASEALWALTEMRPVENQSAFEVMSGPDEYPAIRPEIAKVLGL